MSVSIVERVEPAVRSSRWPFYYGWVNLGMAALAMTATLPGRTHGLGLVTEPLLADLDLKRVPYAALNFWATLIGAAFCLPVGWAIDRLGVRLVLSVVLLALGATVQTDRRGISADDFFKGLYETALAPGEIITAVRFPVPEKAGYVKFRQPASRFAIVGVFVAKTPGGVRVAVTGAGPCAFRAKRMEKVLAKDFTPKAIEKIVLPAEGLNSDMHADPEYRAHLVTVMAQRAVAEAARI